MNSLQLTKEKMSKFWWTAPILYVAFAILGSLIASPITNLISSDPFIQEQIGGLYGFAGCTLLAIIYTVWYKKRSIGALGFKKEGFFKNYGTGLLIGITLAIFVIGTATLLGGFKFSFNANVSWMWIFISVAGYFIQGLTEEVLTRGFLFNELSSHKGRIFGVIVSAIAFTALHGANPGITIMPIINLFAFGVFFALLFWITDNIWVVGATHAVWNFILGPVLGILVSGQAFPVTIFNSVSTEGMNLINGGGFGVEGSMFTSIFAIIGIVIMIVILKKKGEIKF